MDYATILAFQDGHDWLSPERDGLVVHHRGRYVIAILSDSTNRRYEPNFWGMSSADVLAQGYGERLADLMHDVPHRWPVTRALGRIVDAVGARRWNGDAGFLAA